MGNGTKIKNKNKIKCKKNCVAWQLWQVVQPGRVNPVGDDEDEVWWRLIHLPHDVLPPQEASPRWETCPGSPSDGQSRIWRSPQSPPDQPQAAAPSLPAQTCPSRSPLRRSGGPWGRWSRPRPPGWTWSWPSCWSTCARCPGVFPSCRPPCPAPAPPLRLRSAGASCPRAPSGAGTDTRSPLWGYLTADGWVMTMARNGMEVSPRCLRVACLQGFMEDPNSKLRHMQRILSIQLKMIGHASCHK